MTDPRGAYFDKNCTGSAPFVMGSVRGTRAWSLDEDGWLRGVTYRQVWRPGETEAMCLVTTDFGLPRDYSWEHQNHCNYVVAGVGFPPGDADPMPVKGYALAQCEGLDPDCSCGLYAYHDGATRYGVQGGSGPKVIGVVEGYGRVIVGTQGFRAQKARILGVVAPPFTAALERRAALQNQVASLRATLRAMRAPTPWFDPARGTMCLGIMAAASAWWSFGVAGWYFALGAGTAGAMAAAAVRFELLVRAERHRAVHHVESALAQLEDDLARVPPDYTEHVARMRRNYPDVAVFTSRQQMDEAFPVTSQKHLLEDGGEEVS